jgi:hypothetical protein
MKTQFNNTISKLSDPKRAVTVMAGVKCIVRNATGADLVNDFGSIENFFNSIYESGVQSITILDKTYNGTNGGVVKYKALGDAYEFTFEAKQPGLEATVPAANSMPALASPALNGGLNATIFRDMHYPLISAELETAKSEVKRLTEENRKLETEMLINRTLDGKSTDRTNANAALVKEFTPLASILFEKLMATQSAPALPQGLSGVSPSKMQSVQSIVQCDDATVHLFAKLSEKIDEQAVWNDFEQLLKTHKIA